MWSAILAFAGSLELELEDRQAGCDVSIDSSFDWLEINYTPGQHSNKNLNYNMNDINHPMHNQLDPTTALLSTHEIGDISELPISAHRCTLS